MTNTTELIGLGALGAGIALVTYVAGRLRARRVSRKLAQRERDLRTVAGILIAEDWRERLAQRARVVGVDQLRDEVQALDQGPGRYAVTIHDSYTVAKRADAWLDELDAYPCETLTAITGKWK